MTKNMLKRQQKSRKNIGIKNEMPLLNCKYVRLQLLAFQKLQWKRKYVTVLEPILKKDPVIT